MIYTKKANFPYPILSNDTYDYKEAEFEFDVSLTENTDYFVFNIKYTISSTFIKSLLSTHRARVILIIKSKDNQFHILDKLYNDTIQIPKSRLFVGTRSVLQLMIQTTEEISFKENIDLNEFYQDMKNDIIVSGGMALGFSNLVTFDGSQKKPYDLFEKKVDKSITSDLEVRLGDETILIVYKNEEMQFSGMMGSNELNYPYIYIGLQKALLSFHSHYAESLQDPLDLFGIGQLDNALDEKLYQLMISKNISELSMNNIDEVIYLISNNLLNKYAITVRGMQHAN